MSKIIETSIQSNPKIRSITPNLKFAGTTTAVSADTAFDITRPEIATNDPSTAKTAPVIFGLSPIIQL